MAVLAVDAIFAVTDVVQQLTWVDEPVRRGIDDLAPIGGLVLIPLPMGSHRRGSRNRPSSAEDQAVEPVASSRRSGPPCRVRSGGIIRS